MSRLTNWILLLAVGAMLTTGCKKEDSDPPNNNNNNSTSCPEGMTGPDCETEEREQYIGNYEGEQEHTDDSGDTTTRDVEVDITASSDGITKIDIQTEFIILGTEQIATVTAIVDGNNFTIPEETQSEEIGIGTFTVTTSGDGSLNGNTLIFNYETHTELTSDSGTTETTTSSVTTAEKQ